MSDHAVVLPSVNEKQVIRPMAGAASSIRDRSYLALIFAILVFYPPLYAVYLYGVKAVFGFFAEDAFYYLTVAERSLAAGFPSFDGERLTNGFHPFWQYLLLAIRVVSGKPDHMLWLSFATGAVLVYAGLTLAGWAIAEWTGSWRAALWLIPGIFFHLSRVDLFTSPDTGLRYTYSCWAFINGMETPLSICWGGLLLFMLARRARPGREDSPFLSKRFCLGLGVTLMLLTLSRLDDGFLLPSALLLLPCLGRSAADRVRRLACLWAPTAVALAIYLGNHYLSGQTLLPVSGQSKAGLAAPTNFLSIFYDLLPAGLHLIGIKAPEGVDVWMYTISRSVGLALPILVSLFLMAQLTFRRERSLGEASRLRRGMLLMPLLYVVLKGGYNLLFVVLGHQGYWYYGLSILIVNAMLAGFAWQALASLGAGPPLRQGLALCWATLYLLSSANTIHLSGLNTWNSTCWTERRNIVSRLQTLEPHPRIVDFSDGTIAYALGLPSLSGTGLAIDVEGYRARQEGRFWDYCLARGFNVLAQTPNTPPMSLPGFQLSRLYLDPVSGIEFQRLSKAKAPQAR